MHDNIKTAQYWTNVDMGAGQKLREMTNVRRNIGEWWDKEHYGPIMKNLREIDNNARAVARDVRKDIWDARKYMKSGYYLDVLYKLMAIDQAINGLVNDERLAELKDATKQHLESFYSETKEADPEELEKYFTSQAGFIEDIFDRWGRQRGQQMLDRIYKNQIKKRKNDMNKLFNNSRSFVKKFFTILKNMGTARASGDVGSWMKSLETLEQDKNKWSNQLRSVYNEHFRKEDQQRKEERAAVPETIEQQPAPVATPVQPSAGQFGAFLDAGEQTYPTQLTGGTPVLQGTVQRYNDVVPGPNSPDYLIIFDANTNQYARIWVDAPSQDQLNSLYGRNVTLSGEWRGAGNNAQLVVPETEVESQSTAPAGQVGQTQEAAQPETKSVTEEPSTETAEEPTGAAVVPSVIDTAPEEGVEPEPEPKPEPETQPTVSQDSLSAKLISIYGKDTNKWVEKGEDGKLYTVFEAVNSLAHAFKDDWESLDDVEHVNYKARAGVAILRKLGLNEVDKAQIEQLKEEIAPLKKTKSVSVGDVKPEAEKAPVASTPPAAPPAPQPETDEGEDEIDEEAEGTGEPAVVKSILDKQPTETPAAAEEPTSGNLEKVLNYLTPEKAKDPDIGGAITKAVNIIKSRKDQNKPVPTSESGGEDGNRGRLIERVSGMVGVNLSDLSSEDLEKVKEHIKGGGKKATEPAAEQPAEPPFVVKRRKPKKEEEKQPRRGPVTERAKKIAEMFEAKTDKLDEQLALLKQLKDEVIGALFKIPRNMQQDPRVESLLQDQFGLTLSERELEKFKNDVEQAIRWLKSGKKETEKEHQSVSATPPPRREEMPAEGSSDVSETVKNIALKLEPDKINNILTAVNNVISKIESGEELKPEFKNKIDNFYKKEFGIDNVNAESMKSLKNDLEKALDWHQSGGAANYKAQEKAKAEGHKQVKPLTPEIPDLAELIVNIRSLAEKDSNSYRKLRKIIKNSLLPKFDKDPTKKYKANPSLAAMLGEIGVDIEPGANIVPVIRAVWDAFKNVKKPEEQPEKPLDTNVKPKTKEEAGGGPSAGMKERKQNRQQPDIELDLNRENLGEDADIEKEVMDEIEQELQKEEGPSEEEETGNIPTEWPFERVEQTQGKTKESVQLRQKVKTLAQERLDKIKTLRDFVKAKIGIDSEKLNKLNSYIDQADAVLGRKGFVASKFIDAYKGIAENFKESVGDIVDYLQSDKATPDQKNHLPELQKLKESLYKMAELRTYEKAIKYASSKGDAGLVVALLARYSQALEDTGQIGKSIVMLKKAEQIVNKNA